MVPRLRMLDATRFVQVFERLKDALGTSVRRATATTEQEVLAAGKSVYRVLERSREQLAKTRAVLGRLGSGEGSGVTRVLAEQTRILSSYFRDERNDANLLAGTAQAAVERTRTITAATDEIEGLARRSAVLAMNAQISAAKATGEEGDSFRVIAIELRQLCHAVSLASARLKDVAAGLGSAVPELASAVARQQERATTFAERAEANLASVDRQFRELRADVTAILRDGDVSGEVILRDAQEALAHLQFQDVLAQELRAAAGLVASAEREVAGLGEPDGLAAAVSGPASAAGEVILF
jgi:hypothetical protein